MAEEVKLSPGWLLRDVRRAAERLDPSQHKDGVSPGRDRLAVSAKETGRVDHGKRFVGNGYRTADSSS
jgi:hypothetical protein